MEFKQIGIDISEYQGKVDFSKVKKSGVNFVMIRSGFGKFSSQKDKCFEENYKNAKANKLNTGAYWYSYAQNKEDAKKEAQVFLETIKGKTFEFPIAFDIEDECTDHLTKQEISEIINTFCTECEKSGYYVCVYSYASFLNNRVDESTKKRFDVWVAHYGVQNPDFSGNYGMWQYSCTGKVNGIGTDCDLNYSFKDYPQIIKSKGLNNNKQAKILDKTGYKKNDKGVGVYALNQLLKIAYARKILSVNPQDSKVFDLYTQQGVNELLKKWGYSQNSVAGEKFIRLLGRKLV